MIGAHRRLVGSIAVGTLMLVAALVVPRAIAEDDPSSDGSATSEEVAAPWVDSEGVHYEGEVDDPSGAIGSVTATQHSALVEILHDDESDTNLDPDTETDPLELETILELPIVGEVLELTNRLLGSIVADIQGSLATWTEVPLLGSGIKLVAYDTVTHQVLRTLNIADETARPFAIDGQRIYVGREEAPMMVWDVSNSANQLAPVSNLPANSLVTDAHEGALAFFSSDQTHLIDADGDELKTLDGETWLTFSPDGSHVAGLAWDGSNTMNVFVWNVAAAEEVSLDLPENAEMLDLQWEADGDLLVPTVAIDEDGDRLDVSAVYNSCSTATGECEQLEGTEWIEPSQVGTSSGLTQLNKILGS